MPRRKEVKGKSNTPAKKIQMQEILKCGTDAAYFINNYIKIPHPVKGMIPFNTFPFQDECLEAFQQNKNVIVNKSRQLGLSTIVAAYALWMALFQKEKNILVIAIKLDTAKLFIKKVEAMLLYLPDWLVMPKIKAQSVKYIVFSNGSKIQAIPTSPAAGRGEALSLLIVDEAAHVEGIDDIWLGLQPTLSCVAGDTLVLTDNGFIKIEDFHNGKQIGDYFHLETNVYGKHGLEKTSHGYVSPENETYIITTKHGAQVEVTPIHPLYSLQKNGVGKMIKARNLKINDFLRIEYNQNTFGKVELDDNLAYMLGGYIAEGWVTKRKQTDGTFKFDSIEIENTDHEFRNVFLHHNNLKKKFTIVPSRSTRLRCSSRSLIREWQKLGIDPLKHCYNKTTPISILQGTENTVTKYLSGLFDGDGSVTEDGIVLSSTSEKLIRETSLIMRNLGFVPNIHHISPRTSDIGRIMPQGKPLLSLRDSWRLVIPRSQFDNFNKKIGFKIKRKQGKLECLGKKYNQNQNKLTTIPVAKIKTNIEELLVQSKKTKKWFREQGLRLDKCLDGKTNRTVTQEWLVKFKTILEKNTTLSNCQQEFFNENIGSFFWDPIVKIEKSFNKTYDFTVPKTHSFLQNGILGSNTGGSSILISTPSGVGSLFHKIWVASKEERNDFVSIELPWTVHPERDQEWFEEQRRGIIEAHGERGVAQELLCLDGSTEIITYDGCKKIKDIKIGDKVLTHKGRYRRVTKTYKHKLLPEENMFSISVPGIRNTPIKITDNHPILNYHFKVPKGKNFKNHFRSLEAAGLNPTFDSVAHLNTWKHTTNSTRRPVYGCLFPHINFSNLLESENKMTCIDLSDLGVPTTSADKLFVRYHKQGKKVSTNRYVDVDFELGRLVGLFAAEGHTEENRIGFAFHSNENETLGKFVREKLNAMGCAFYDNNRSYSKCYTILSTNKFLRALFRMFVSPGNARTKRYKFENLLRTNPDFIKGVLVGHFEGDGDHPANKFLENKLKVVSKSNKMLNQLRVLLSIYGLHPRIGFLNQEPSYIEIDGLKNLPEELRNIRGLLNQHNTKMLLEQPTSRSLLVDNQHTVGAIQWQALDISHEYGDSPLVYNIAVEEDESYIAGGLVVHNCSFSASGDTFLRNDVMEKIYINIKEPIAFWGPEDMVKKDLWIWAHPKTGHKYLIGADVARGDGEDFSSFHVIDIDADEVVAEYKGKVAPDKLAEMLVTVAKRYNMAMICPEKNSVGVGCCLKLKELKYPNLYFDKLHKNVYMVYTAMDTINELPGFETGQKNRVEILARLEDVLRNRRLKTYSKRLYEELQTFIWKGNKPMAQKGYNDDLVMALAIANSLYEANGTNTFSDDDMAKAMLAGMSVAHNSVESNSTSNNSTPPIMTDGSLSSFIDQTRTKSLQNAKTHNYNDPIWKVFGWMWD